MSIGSRGSRGFRRLLLAALAAFTALAAPAQAEETLLSRSIDATGSIAADSCTDRPLDGAGTWSERIVSPALGGIKATLSGGSGDWDLAIFSAGSGDTVAGSAYTGSDEVAGGWAFEDEPLIVQACALPGASGSPQLDVTVTAIERDQATPPPSLLRVSVPDDEALRRPLRDRARRDRERRPGLRRRDRLRRRRPGGAREDRPPLHDQGRGPDRSAARRPLRRPRGARRRERGSPAAARAPTGACSTTARR